MSWTGLLSQREPVWALAALYYQCRRRQASYLQDSSSKFNKYLLSAKYVADVVLNTTSPIFMEPEEGKIQ